MLRQLRWWMQRLGLSLALLLFLGPVASSDLGIGLGWGTSSSLAAEAETHAPVGDPQVLEFQPNLAVWSLVVFLAMLAILWKYAWAPIIEALDQREKDRQHAYDDAENARLETQRIRAEYDGKLKSAHDEVRAIIEEARRDADVLKAEILRAANADVAENKARLERTIQLAKDEALKEIWTLSAQLSVSIAGRILQKEFSGDDQKRLVELAIAELPKQTDTGLTAGV